ncbi:hypothetical protein EKL98_12745 [Flavobacterium bomense]|uniref:Uncharacterized protein n=1 Tax=Flavobacterium bomense TaxID=2497483 RepID=A0A3S0MY76_9FLAO|nr:hypothetical protein [Flavobacterium bomense]RTZ02723.1 hypothetical protein EKL98_12745 [Flavobacterium bomense]
MKKLKSSIQKVVTECTYIDWLILHKIENLTKSTTNVSFSSIDEKEAPSKPFNKNEGYISLKNSKMIKIFNEIILELVNDFANNTIAISNLFIILTRTSYNGENEEILIENFKNKIGKKQSKNIFQFLLASLNEEYFKRRYSKKEFPDNPNEWLQLFQASQYSSQMSDPIIAALQLVKSGTDRKLDFVYIENMTPIIRAVLIGWYAFDIKISKAKMLEVLKNKNELVFLSAYIIDDIGSDKIIPNWLNQNLINKFIEDHWDNIGKHLFIHIFGLSYRNQSQGKWNKKIENFIHKTLYKKIVSDDFDFPIWMNKIIFPDSFIALFSWFTTKKISFNKITEKNKKEILNQFISELQRISKELPNSLASENSFDPFDSYRLNELKYRNALAFLLLFFLFDTTENLKEIKNICYDFKPLFYGGYSSRSLATHFTEIIFLIALSGNKIKGVEDDKFEKIKQLLDILEETVLVPYIHISERQEEIWNPECEKEIMTFNTGKFLINNDLKELKKSKVKNHYSQLYGTLELIKIAQWPYER